MFLRFLISLSVCAVCSGQTKPRLEPDNLTLHNVTAEIVAYNGKSAPRVADAGGEDLADGPRLAIVQGTKFQDGTIEVELAGDTLPGKGPVYRGFTGIAFRVSSDGKRYECFYLRPKNGRSEYQSSAITPRSTSPFPNSPGDSSVNGANQPALIVNDLKHAVSSGAIALFVDPGTLAHLASLRVTGTESK